MEIGDKLLEKIEENHGKRVTKLMTGLILGATCVTCLGIILKAIQLFFVDIFMPFYSFFSSINYSKYINLGIVNNKEFSNATGLVAASLSSVSLVITIVDGLLTAFGSFISWKLKKMKIFTIGE